jgi:hypothetical protein
MYIAPFVKLKRSKIFCFTVLEFSGYLEVALNLNNSLFGNVLETIMFE